MKTVDVNETKNSAPAPLQNVAGVNLAAWAGKVLIALVIVLGLYSAPFIAMQLVVADDAAPLITRSAEDTDIGYQSPEDARCAPGETLIKNWRGGYSCNVGEWVGE